MSSGWGGAAGGGSAAGGGGAGAGTGGGTLSCGCCCAGVSGGGGAGAGGGSGRSRGGVKPRLGKLPSAFCITKLGCIERTPGLGVAEAVLVVSPDQSLCACEPVGDCVR